jgi:hypothetical protein
VAVDTVEPVPPISKDLEITGLRLADRETMRRLASQWK